MLSIAVFPWSHICWHCAEDEQFEADKAQVMREIAALEPKEQRAWAADWVKLQVAWW